MFGLFFVFLILLCRFTSKTGGKAVNFPNSRYKITKNAMPTGQVQKFYIFEVCRQFSLNNDLLHFRKRKQGALTCTFQHVTLIIIQFQTKVRVLNHKPI